MRSLGLIPARGGSKRLPNKNIASLNGKPLISYAIDSALASDAFDEIIVSSDDEAVLEVARRYPVTIHERPARLARDDVSVLEFSLELLEELAKQGKDYDTLTILWTINPTRTPKDIRAACKLLVEEHADFVISVTNFRYNPLRALVQKQGKLELYFGEDKAKRDQELPELFAHDGNILHMRTEALKKEKTFFGKNTVPYETPHATVDINTQEDLELAEALMRSHTT